MNVQTGHREAEANEDFAHLGQKERVGNMRCLLNCLFLDCCNFPSIT